MEHLRYIRRLQTGIVELLHHFGPSRTKKEDLVGKAIRPKIAAIVLTNRKGMWDVILVLFGVWCLFSS